MSLWRRDQMSAVRSGLGWSGESKFLGARAFGREGGRGSLIERA